MLTENSSGFSAHSKKIQDVAGGTLSTDLLNKGQFEDGSQSPTFNNLTVNGVLTAAALTADSVAPAITAKAGGGQDATLALSKNLNIVTVCATAGDSVTLPSAAVGLRITVVNLGATALAVFPYTSDSINDEVADASVTIQPETTVTFNCYTTVLWQSNNESLTSFDKLYITGLLYESLTTGITAFATGGQASATALTKNLNNVTVCATAGDSVKLPAAEAGIEVFVKNSGATALDIFPASGDSIDALAVNLAVRIAPSSTARFVAISATVWESNVDASLTLVAPTTNTGGLQILAAPSAGNTLTTITNASQAAARTYTIPDAGGNASFVQTEGAQTINGIKTFGSGIVTPAGTVGTPSVQVGSVDTGFYQVSATQTGMSQDGTLVALFDADGFMADSVRNRVNLGTTPVGTVSIAEYGDGKDITTVLTLTNFIVGALAGAGANLGIGNIVYAFPAGQHLELVSSLSSIVLTAAGTAVATDTGLGSVIASGAVAVLSGTAEFEDRLTGQTINTAVGGGAAVSALTAATAGIGTGISLNVAGSVKNVYLNSAGAWNADNTGDLTATGTIILKWTVMS